MSAFAKVGPLIDGHVEIPLGSGCRFAADGMLSQHADFPRVQPFVRAADFRDVPLARATIFPPCDKSRSILVSHKVDGYRPLAEPPEGIGD